MATVPTGKMERELRRLYMQWVNQLPQNERRLHKYVASFQEKSMKLIEKMGGDIARLGALAGFPAPRELDLSPHIGTIYSDMELAAIKAQISLGLNPLDTARALQRAGVDKSFRRLERLARTETVSAYWKNAWDSIDGLGLVMVWGAENGPRTCQWCHDRDGMVMDSPDLRDHPNGRCTPLPTHPSQVDYKGSVRADGQIYQDPEWNKPISKSVTPDSIRSAADMGADVQAATASYTSTDFSWINKYLRGERGYDKLSDDMLNTISVLDKAIDGSKLPKGTALIRAEHDDMILDRLGIKDIRSFDPSSVKGKSWVEDAFTSTSLDGLALTGHAAEVLDRRRVLLKIETHAGAKGISTGVADGSNEVVLKRGTKFTVISAVYDEALGKLIVRVFAK